MTQAERWQRVKELLNAALERPSHQREAFLAEHCVGDAEMRAEVDSLLSSFAEAHDFMEPDRQLELNLRPDTAPTEDLRIGPYAIICEVGRGGMGTVYKVHRADDRRRHPLAIKIVRRGMDHEFVLRRFRTERTILAALDHPNIARLIDAGATDDGVPYFVMEYVEGGRNLVDYADTNRLSTEDRLRLFVKLCSAVGCAHERRIIHRDIKPGNVLIDVHGELKLLDFGIAKILDPDFTSQTIDVTATILRMMTPEYASPEQVRGEEITPASDVYSLGVLLYELLTGHRPYRLKTKIPHEIAAVICEEDPERPSTVVGRTEIVTRGDTAITLDPFKVCDVRQTEPSELRRTLAGHLDNIVLMAMRKEPARRYRTAEELGADIEHFLQGESVTARPETLFHQAARTVRHHQRLAVAGGVILLLVVAISLIKTAERIQSSLDASSGIPKTIPLTNFPGDEGQAAFSPDSSRVAFVWQGENSDNSDIYIKPVNGVGLERITTDRAEDLSPSWSPDGKRIAWLRVREDETGIFVSAAQPGDFHRSIASVSPNRIEAVGRHLDWSPDGTYVAAADRASEDEPFRIVTVEVATGQKKQLTTPPPGSVGDSNPIYSPDGKYIAFIRGVSSGVDDIFIQPLDGGPTQRVTNDHRYIISLSWSADSKMVYFSSNRSGGHYLWRVPITGGTPERLTWVGENVSDATVSRDGRYLAYSKFYQDTNIWALDVDTLARRRFIVSTQYDSSAHWSLDGSVITFRSSRSGTQEIWAADADGNHQRQVTHMGNTLSGSPKISPDGKRIAFDSRPEGQPEIFAINVDGSSLTRITNDPAEDVVPAWSADGRWIYFGSNRGGNWQVWKVLSTGGAPEQVTHSGGFAARESPDGQWVYYARGRSIPGLWRVRPDGSNEQPVLDRLKPGLWAYWVITRAGLYFIDRDPDRQMYALFLQAQPGREPVRLIYFDRPIIPADQGMTASPDGKTLLYTQVDQSGSDILVMELNRVR